VTLAVKTLPKERAAVDTETVRVTVARGGYSVGLPDGSSIGLEGDPGALIQRFRAEKERLPAGAPVVLHPRFDVPHGDVVRLLAALRGAGDLLGAVSIGPPVD